jgi:hypothetical protein
MQAVVITSHGYREQGTSACGTYVVPPDTEIYFFTQDAEMLTATASDYFMDLLCTDNPDEDTLMKYVKEVKREWDVIPNYRVRGDSAFRDKTGIYLVGRPRGRGPLRELLPGEISSLAQLVSGARKGSACARRIYWLACREAILNSYEAAFAQVVTNAEVCPQSGDSGSTTYVSKRKEASVNGAKGIKSPDLLWKLKGLNFTDVSERKARRNAWIKRMGLM